MVARFKDDGYSAFKEIRRDGFVNLIEAIERDEIDVVIIRDVDRLTRNLPDWSRSEKAAVEHRVILGAYAGGDLDLSTPEGSYYGGMVPDGVLCTPSGAAGSVPLGSFPPGYRYAIEGVRGRIARGGRR